MAAAAELADLPLELRAAAARHVIAADPSLTAADRLELLDAAIWPRRAAIPDAAPLGWPGKAGYDPAVRAEAARMRAAGVSASQTARNIGISKSAVLSWTEPTRRAGSDSGRVESPPTV